MPKQKSRLPRKTLGKASPVFLFSYHPFPPAWLTSEMQSYPPDRQLTVYKSMALLFHHYSHGPAIPGDSCSDRQLDCSLQELPKGPINSSFESLHQQTVHPLKLFGSCASNILALLFPPTLNCYDRILTHSYQVLSLKHLELPHAKLPLLSKFQP